MASGYSKVSTTGHDAPSYTRDISMEPLRRAVRTNPALLAVTPLVDTLHTYLSVCTGCAVFFGLIVAQSLVIPFIVVSKIGTVVSAWCDPLRHRTGNVSTSTGSLSAIKVLSARATARNVGIGSDVLAPRLMGVLSLYGYGVWGGRFVTRCYLTMYRWNFGLVHRMFGDQIVAAVSNMPFGEIAFCHSRTCWLDDAVERFLQEHQEERHNLVILGAGYDTRCYRLVRDDGNGKSNTHRFEVDTAATQYSKMASLVQSGIVRSTQGSNVTYVPCDFTSQNWLERCQDAGLDPALPTFLAWEGVCMYLPPKVAEETVRVFGTKFAAGSCLAFDWLESSWAINSGVQKLSRVAGEPFTFGMTGSEPEDLVARINAEDRTNLTVLDQVKHEEAIERYLPRFPDGRPLAPLGNYGGFMIVGVAGEQQAL